MGYKVSRDERFSQLGEKLFIKMAELSPNAKTVFTLLFLNIIRNTHTWEPTKQTNQFKLSYLDYGQYGIARTSFDRAIVELTEKKFIRVTGRQRNKTCKILKW